MPYRTILCISFDGLVSEGRCRSLKDAGYEVTATINVNEGMELLNRKKLDAVIIGHRFSTEEKRLLAEQAKKAGIPVVLVCGATSESSIPATSRVYALEGGAGLLSALSRLFVAETAA